MDRYTCEQAFRDMDAYLDRELGVAALQEFRAYHTFDDIEDFSYEQIADVVGSPIGTVRFRLHRSC